MFVTRSPAQHLGHHQEEKILLRRQCAAGSLPSTGAATFRDSNGEPDFQDIPTIVLRPELAIQTLDMFSQCTSASCCSDHLPVLKAANIDSCTASQTVLFGLDERKKTNKRRRAAFASATVVKNTEEDVLGMGLKKANGSLQVSSLRPNCLLSEAPFQVGDKIISINNVDCAKKSLSQIAAMLKRSTGLLTVVVEHPEGDPKLVESMIMKETPTSKTGLGVAPSAGQQIKISSINSNGIFASSLLSRRDRILSVNDTPCEYLQDVAEAAKLIVNAKRTVTILAERRSDNAAVVAQAA